MFYWGAAQLGTYTSCQPRDKCLTEWKTDHRNRAELIDGSCPLISSSSPRLIRAAAMTTEKIVKNGFQNPTKSRGKVGEDHHVVGHLPVGQLPTCKPFVPYPEESGEWRILLYQKEGKEIDFWMWLNISENMFKGVWLLVFLHTMMTKSIGYRCQTGNKGREDN